MKDLSEFYDMMEKFHKKVQDIQKQSDIRNAFIACRIIQEVNDIVINNIDFINIYPFLLKFAREARVRINRIRREKEKSWKNQLN